MRADDQERRRENLILAHAKVQGELLMLFMAIAGGYGDVEDPHEIRRRLASDSQDVVDAAIALRRTVLTDGNIRPPGV